MAELEETKSACLIDTKVQNIRILHVDDDRQFLELSKEILSIDPIYLIENVSCVDDALERLSEKEFDIIISDYDMPQKDGIQFLKELKQRNIHTPFVLFTGKGREEVAIKALNLGAAGYFNKNCDPETVYGELSHGIKNIYSLKTAREERKKEAHLRDILLDNVPCTAMILEKFTRKIVKSNKLARSLGAYPGKTCYGTCAERSAPCEFCLAPKVWEGNQPQFLEVKSGEKFYQGIWVPFSENLYIHYIFDITDRMQAQEETELQKVKAENYLNIVKNVIMALDRNGEIILLNKTGYQILGYTPGELQGKNWAETCLPVEVRKEIVAMFGRWMKGEVQVLSEFENQVITKNGERKAIRWHNTELRDNQGCLIGTLSSGEDVTEQKEMENQLIENEKKFRTLFEGMTEGAFWQSADGTLLDINDAALDMFGITKEEFLSRTSDNPQWKVITEDGFLLIGQKHPSMEALLTAKAVNKIVGVYNPKKEEYVWVNVSAIPQFRGDSKKPFQVFVTLHNVSDLKKAQNKIESVSEKLRVVGGLTRHDVGNKLSVISANLYLLMKKNDNPELLKHLEAIKSSVSSSNRILDFGRDYENIGVEEPEKINVFETFNQAFALHGEKHNIVVTNDTKGLTVLADSLLQSVFYNFIDNSIKHGKGTKNINLHFFEQTETIKLIYEDDGIGVPYEFKPLLFSEGFTMGGGTGLGLALSKKILEVYGWMITENGKPGTGIRFEIEIPKPNQ